MAEFHRDPTISALIGKFRARLSDELTVVHLQDIDPDLEEVWYFRPATGTQADAIIKKVSDGNYFAAQVEALFQRCYTEEGKRRFRTADKEALMKLDPEFVAAISERIGAFEDLTPDVEELEKNSGSTSKRGHTSTSEKGSD